MVAFLFTIMLGFEGCECVEHPGPKGNPSAPTKKIYLLQKLSDKIFYSQKKNHLLPESKWFLDLFFPKIILPYF
jgi:hypothetical protein